jgi:hypothetical protein
MLKSVGSGMKANMIFAGVIRYDVTLHKIAQPTD